MISRAVILIPFATFGHAAAFAATFAAFGHAAAAFALPPKLQLLILLFLFVTCPQTDTRLQRIQDQAFGRVLVVPVSSLRVRKVRNHYVERVLVAMGSANVLSCSELAGAIRTVAVEKVSEAVIVTFS